METFIITNSNGKSTTKAIEYKDWAKSPNVEYKDWIKSPNVVYVS